VFEVARGHEIDLGSYAGNSCPNGMGTPTELDL
jgi:hypothetical protein